MMKRLIEFHSLEDWERQYQIARKWIEARIRELEAEGFVYNDVLGCWQHPNGSEVWIDG